MLKEIILNTQKYPNMDEQIRIIQENQNPIYIFGGLGAMSLGSIIANYLSLNKISFEGFLVNKSFMSKKEHMGKPVFAIEETSIDINSNIIIGISKWLIAKEELNHFGYKNTFVFDCFSEKILEPITLEYFLEHYDRFYSTYSILEDELSKKSMTAYLQGKIFNNFTGLSKTYFAHIQNDGGGAYFNNILPFGKNEIMIDCGAFNGDTAIAFTKKYNNYRKIYAYEPDANMFNQLLQNTKNLNIVQINKGVFSSTCTLNFNIQNNGCSTFEKNGSMEIQVEAIDALLKDEKDPITFIKMDIEGSELEALKGASSIIQLYKPKLAICVYHRSNDLFAIPEILKSLRNDYKFFIRNHQMVPEDTVLYAY